VLSGNEALQQLRDHLPRIVDDLLRLLHGPSFATA
jgi:hypothetical protein